MKAARWYGIGDIRLVDVPEPTTGPHDVKIEVTWCGICGSDIGMYLKGPIMPVCAPVTVGHEFSGTVVERGEQVRRLQVGQRVVVDPYIVCHSCFWCTRGEGGSLCEKLSIVGYTIDGGLTRYVTVREDQVHDVGDMPHDIAALAQPTVIGVHMVGRAGLRQGETALVMGCGPIGIANVLAGKWKGAKVIAAERAEARRTIAAALGADLVVNPDEQNLEELVRKETGGIGVDVAFECVGTEATMKACFALTRKGGRIVAIGFTDATFPTTINELIRKRQTIIGALGYADEFPEAIRLLGELGGRATAMITGKIPLEQVLGGGYMELIHNKEKHMKILVSPI